MEIQIWWFYDLSSKFLFISHSIDPWAVEHCILNKKNAFYSITVNVLITECGNVGSGGTRAFEGRSIELHVKTLGDVTREVWSRPTKPLLPSPPQNEHVTSRIMLDSLFFYRYTVNVTMLIFVNPEAPLFTSIHAGPRIGQLSSIRDNVTHHLAWSRPLSIPFTQPASLSSTSAKWSLSCTQRGLMELTSTSAVPVIARLKQISATSSIYNQHHNDQTKWIIPLVTW